MTKEKQSNFELMRIISMFLIIIHHIILHGNVIYNTSGSIHLIIMLIRCIAFVHVNSFILLTGYFQYKKEFSLKKFLSIFNASYFYNLLILIIFIIFGLSNIEKLDVLKTLNPFYMSHWFISCYLILYILSPFINILIKNMSQKNHRKLILLLILCYSIISFLSEQTIAENSGYSVIQFIMLYIIGAYLSKYPINQNLHFKNYSKNKLQVLLFSGIFVFAFINFILYCLSRTFEDQNNLFFNYLGTLIANNYHEYNFLPVIIQSVLYFLWFETLNIQNKIINKISSLVFGIYIIHDNPFIRGHIYKWFRIDSNTTIYSKKIFIKIFIVAFLIFIICAIIEFLRQLLFKFIKKRKLYIKFSSKFNNYINEL